MTQEPATTLAHDQRGTILVLWGILLGVVLGFVAMSFDLGRASITRSELQSFADSVALAAAGELDANPDAITRAEAAAALILDQQSFGNTERELQGELDYTLTYYPELPDSDTDAIGAEADGPEDAAFVRVLVTPTVVESTFGAAFAALTGQQNRDFTLGAEAVAGLSILACDIQPMMFCLPTPDFRADDHIGDSVLLRSRGGSAAWTPGNFSFLDPTDALVDPSGPCAGLSNARLTQCLVGAVGSITQCFNQRGVDILTGQRVGLSNTAFNVRFDLYEGNMSRFDNDPNYAPAPHVIKGWAPVQPRNPPRNPPTRQCNLERVTTSMPFPPDDCLVPSNLRFGECGTPGDIENRFGDGDWSTGRELYETTNYGRTRVHPSATTRYEYYLAEIEASGGSAILAGRESGLPTCNRPPAGPDRRVITVAGIDCSGLSDNGSPINGSENDVPVREFFKIFLTAPVEQNLDIYGEIIGSASEAGTGAIGTGGIVRDVVQLYR